MVSWSERSPIPRRSIETGPPADADPRRCSPRRRQGTEGPPVSRSRNANCGGERQLLDKPVYSRLHEFTSLARGTSRRRPLAGGNPHPVYLKRLGVSHGRCHLQTCSGASWVRLSGGWTWRCLFVILPLLEESPHDRLWCLCASSVIRSVPRRNQLSRKPYHHTTQPPLHPLMPPGSSPGVVVT